MWPRQGFEGSVKYPRFVKGLPGSPVRGREGLAALASYHHGLYSHPWPCMHINSGRA